MTATTSFTRREWLGTMGVIGAAALTSRTVEAEEKPFQGVFKILATPYKEDKSVDYEDLAAEVDFLVRAGMQGLVWPQNSSDLPWLTSDEVMEGMEVVAKAAAGTAPTLVLGVQGNDIATMLDLAHHAVKLGPDALIAMPPKNARSIGEYREYYTELCNVTSKPIFIQTSAGAPDIEPTIDFIVELGEKLSNFGYIKEEYGDTLARMKQAARHRPGAVKRIFGGSRARSWTYEMRLGMDGMMTGGPQYAEVYARIWELHREGRHTEVRDLYAKMMLVTNLESFIPGLRPYLMKQRGIFKTGVTRRGDYELDANAVAEVEYNMEPLKPYLTA